MADDSYFNISEMKLSITSLYIISYAPKNDIIWTENSEVTYCFMLQRYWSTNPGSLRPGTKDPGPRDSHLTDRYYRCLLSSLLLGSIIYDIKSITYDRIITHCSLIMLRLIVLFTINCKFINGNATY